MGSNQSDRHGDHVLRWSGVRIWSGADADRRGEPLRLHDTGVVATRCHDGADRCRSSARGRPGNRSHGFEARTDVDRIVAWRPRVPDRADPAPVGKHTLYKSDAVGMDNDVTRGHGREPRPGDGDLQKRQLGNAIRRLYVSRQSRA